MNLEYPLWIIITLWEFRGLISDGKKLTTLFVYKYLKA